METGSEHLACQGSGLSDLQANRLYSEKIFSNVNMVMERQVKYENDFR